MAKNSLGVVESYSDARERELVQNGLPPDSPRGGKVGVLYWSSEAAASDTKRKSIETEAKPKHPYKGPRLEP